MEWMSVLGLVVIAVLYVGLLMSPYRDSGF